MDECDIAQERIDAHLSNLIAEHQYKLAHAVSDFEPGRCRNCEDRLDDGRVYCDADCARDFHDRQRMSKRAGRI